MFIKKIISGGQTGVDRAALDVALKLGIPHGGYIPKGRIAEDGPLPKKYHLQEMPTDSYEARTEKNVQDSDGTLIIVRGKLTGGADYTRHMALRHKKQLLGIELNLIGHFDAASLATSWIATSSSTPQVPVNPIPLLGCHTNWQVSISMRQIKIGFSIPSLL